MVEINGANSVWSSAGFKDVVGNAASNHHSGTINLTGTIFRSMTAGAGLTNLSAGVFDISSDGTAMQNNIIGTFNNTTTVQFCANRLVEVPRLSNGE